MTALKYPCPESVDSFSNKNGEIHCEACSRNLIDFTGMSNEEVQQTIADNPGGCGVFYEDQISDQHQNENRSMFRIAFAVVFVLGINASVFAQSCHTTQSEHVKIEQNEGAKKRVFGQVIDHNGDPIHKANVQITVNGESIYLTTDKEGKFELGRGVNLTGEVNILVSKNKLQDELITINRVAGSMEFTVSMYKEYKYKRRHRRRTAGFYASNYSWMKNDKKVKGKF